MWVADDILFETEHPLDEVYRVFKEHVHERVIVSMNYYAPEGWNHFYQYDLESPIMRLCGLIPAKLWHEVGGIDRLVRVARPQ